MNSFKPNEIAVIKKGIGGVVFVKVISKFTSTLKCNKNPSLISYNIKGYEIRDWCFCEELRKANIFDRILYHFIKLRLDKKFV